MLQVANALLPFKRVKIERRESGAAYVAALKRIHCFLGDRVEQILLSASFKLLAPGVTRLEFAEISVGDAGFPKGTTYGAFSDKLVQLGACIDAQEVAPLFRLAYTNQADNEYYRVVTRPIELSIGAKQVIHRILDVGKSAGKMRLDDRDGFEGLYLRPDERFVCALQPLAV